MDRGSRLWRIHNQELHIVITLANNTVELITERSSQSPAALALSADGLTFTHHELEARSSQLGHYLRSLGVRREEPVGLLIRRSPAAVIGALGILKAGAAYLPLDPAYPADRLSFMLKDAGVRVVLAGGALPALPLGAFEFVNLDTDAARIGSHSTEAPSIEVTPGDLAYIIYTSGSTGQPKGVEVTHGGLSNLVCWHQEAFGVSSRDRASQVASFGFDAAVWEIWPYLSAGASVHFAGDAARTEPEALRDWMVEQRITIGFVPTPVAEHMIALSWPLETSLRCMLTGADTLRGHPQSGLPFMLVNNYGPTECTVVSTSGVVAPGGPRDQQPSIGRPIRNAYLRILDQDFRPVQPGETGELYIGGAGLARGYVNRPDLTAEKFIRDPFEPDSNARLYRTGDLARCLPDGRIAFAGRTDNQIKVRGYRIEPDEIVRVLTSHPCVRSAVVAACPDSFGEKNLVAYLVRTELRAASDSDLRESLRLRLPEYMVPDAFVWLDRFPLTVNGKVDLNALQSAAVPEDVAGETETRLVSMLTRLLKVTELDRHQNFFQIGGSSLLGAQLVARVRETFGVELTLRKLFEAPTAATLAVTIEALRSRGAKGTK
jgi:amino acid adenylation domain-containing protein